MVLEQEIGGIEDVRPMRQLFVRRLTVGKSTDNPHQQQASASAACSVQLVFQHGTCASEQQFQFLLEALDRKLSDSASSSKLGRIKCILYDSVGCAQSPPLQDAHGYSTEEQTADLAAVLEKFADASLPTILITHSSGINIVIQLLKQLHKEKDLQARLPKLSGIIFMSGALRSDKLVHADGGHVLMRLPVFVLNCLQSALTNAFVTMAVHASRPDLQQLIRGASQQNNMAVVKAIHRQSKWATVQDLEEAFQYGEEYGKEIVPISSVLILHGAEDQIISVECAQHLANHLTFLSSKKSSQSTAAQSKEQPQQLVILERTSHMIMMEQPDKVADEILALVKSVQVDS